MKGIFNAAGLVINWICKSRYRIISCVFFILLVFPVVTYPLLKNILPSEKEGLIENRNLNKFEFSLQNFGANFETFYQDNFPFRNSLIPLYNKYYNSIYSRYFAEKTEHADEWEIDEVVIIERDNIDEFVNIGWDTAEEPVKNDSRIAEEPVRNERNTAEEPVRIDSRETEISRFERFMNALAEADAYFNSLNKKIIFQACPRKRYITSRMTGITETDSLSSFIERNSNVSFSYPKNEYIANDINYMTYDEYNSHHNFIGAYISWQEIQKKAGIETTDINSIEITEFEIDARRIITTPYDITCCYPYNQDLPAVRKTEYIKSINYNVAYKPDIEIETLHNTGCFRLEFKSGSANGLTLFLTGDSFIETQIQYAIKDFEFSNISHLYNWNTGSRNQAYRDRIKGYIESADVIVIVVGENNLWSNNLEENPGLEHRLALIMELAREVYWTSEDL